MSHPSAPPGPTPQCYRHPGRETWIACQRCRRPICPECMITAPVGVQCPECVAQGAKETRQHQGPYGGLRSTNPALTSIGLIVANVAVWALLYLTGGHASRWFHLLSLSPTGTCLLADDPTRYLPGADPATCLALSGTWWAPGVAEGAWWQVLSSGFAHVDPLHLGFNMLALWFLGPQLEATVGRTRFLAIYLVSLLGGSALVMWLSDPDTSTLGASGAVFGLIGALLVLAHKVGANLQPLLIWLGINAVYSFLGSGISWQGHVGGLLGGLAATAIVAYASKAHRSRFQLIGLVGTAVLLLALIGARALQLG